MPIRQQNESLEQWWERVSQEALDRHADERAKGLHDAQCEWRHEPGALNGFHMCHCSKRKREREGFTEAPELHWQYPLCGHCWQEVDHDGDSFYCPRCHVSWSNNATDGDTGEFTDDHGDLAKHLAAWEAKRPDSSHARPEPTIQATRPEPKEN